MQLVSVLCLPVSSIPTSLSFLKSFFLVLYIQVLYFIEAAIQQRDDIEVLKKEHQHSSGATVKRDMGVQFTFMEPVSGIMIYNAHL